MVHKKSSRGGFRNWKKIVQSGKNSFEMIGTLQQFVAKYFSVKVPTALQIGAGIIFVKNESPLLAEAHLNFFLKS